MTRCAVVRMSLLKAGAVRQPHPQSSSKLGSDYDNSLSGNNRKLPITCKECVVTPNSTLSTLQLESWPNFLGLGFKTPSIHSNGPATNYGKCRSGFPHDARPILPALQLILTHLCFLCPFNSVFYSRIFSKSP